MVQISAVYEGQKRCLSTHVPSGAHLETDAPKDNYGRAETFSPTDLMATALGTCILTTLSIVAERDNFDIIGSKMIVEKVMQTSPRRIASLKTIILLPARIPEDYRRKLELSAQSCPVKKSMHPDIEIPIEFKYTI